jgi:hypothetical protein
MYRRIHEKANKINSGKLQVTRPTNQNQISAHLHLRINLTDKRLAH